MRVCEQTRTNYIYYTYFYIIHAFYIVKVVAQNAMRGWHTFYVSLTFRISFYKFKHAFSLRTINLNRACGVTIRRRYNLDTVSIRSR